MISSDKSILLPQSKARERMIEYGNLVKNLDIILFCKKSSSIANVATLSKNTRVIPTLSRSKLFYVIDAYRAARRCVLDKVDIVTAQDPFEAGLAGWLIACRKRAKLQLQIHTDFLSQYFIRGSLKNKIRVFLAKFLLPKADGIRVVSERIKLSLQKSPHTPHPTILRSSPEVGAELRNGKAHQFVLPIFVDVAKIQSSPINVDLHQKYPEFDFIIFMASRLEAEKNISLAIYALSQIVKKHPRVGLVIAGSGSQEEILRNQIINLKLDGNVVFEGWIQDLSSYFKTCDAYLLCSNYEGYGMTLIQAAACGCPIIATDVGVVGEVINKENALIVDIGDAKGIADAIEKLIDDKNLRKNLAYLARQSVEKIGTRQEYLENYKKSWEILL